MVLTHLHFDHAGGAVLYDENNNLVPAFSILNIMFLKNRDAGLSPSPRDRASYIKNYIL